MTGAKNISSIGGGRRALMKSKAVKHNENSATGAAVDHVYIVEQTMGYPIGSETICKITRYSINIFSLTPNGSELPVPEGIECNLLAEPADWYLV